MITAEKVEGKVPVPTTSPSRPWVTIWDSQDGSPDCGQNVILKMVVMGCDPDVATAINHLVYMTTAPGLLARLHQNQN